MKIFLSFGVLLLLLSCAQKKENSLTEAIIPERYTLKSSPTISIHQDTVFLNEKKYSGYVVELDAASLDTLSIQGYLDGLQSGVGKKWYSNGQLMEERSYFKGAKNGLQTAYWENGAKKFEFVAREDAYEGEFKEWNIEGNLIHLAHFENGQENGSQKLWDEEGKIRANYVIVNGKRYGLLGTKNCKNVSDSIFNAN
jgi:antitoxin component YwqK of YwqJK toxin-antitoxin module